MVKNQIQRSIEPMKDVTGYLEQREINELLEACEEPRDHLLILLLSRTGRRISEIIKGKEEMGIRVRDIDWDNKIIRIVTLKRRKEKNLSRENRTIDLVPIDDKTLKHLKEYIELKNIAYGQFVFPISRQRAFGIIRRIGRISGINKVGKKRLHPHHFRHSFAVHGARTIKNPAGLRLIQEIMGHSDISITAKYLKFNPYERRKLIKKMWKD